MVAETGSEERREEEEKMTRKEWAEMVDQLENSLVRAEGARKDIDLLILLRMAHKIAKERLKVEENDGRKT